MAFRPAVVGIPDGILLLFLFSSGFPPTFLGRGSKGDANTIVVARQITDLKVNTDAAVLVCHWS